MESLRIATLNIWNKSGPWARRMELIRDVLMREQPDIIGLQEVLELNHNGKTQNQATELVPEGFHWCYGMGHDVSHGWAAGAKLSFGNAVVSRYPIVHHEVIPLPGADVTDQQRSMLHAVLEVPTDEGSELVDVFVTHLNWKLDEGWVREKQVLTIAETVDRLRQGSFPPVLMGDFNAEPISDELRYLKGLTRLGQERSTRFIDLWDWQDDRDVKTFDGRRNPFAAEHPEVPRCLDYIFLRAPLRKRAGTPLSVRLAFDEPVDGVFCSDHFGVIADIRFKS